MVNTSSFTELTSSNETVWDAITRWALYLMAFLMPFWVLPFTPAPLDTGKVLLLAVLGIVGFIAWLGKAIALGGIRIPKSITLGLLIVWLLVLAFATFFSVSPHGSFWGYAANSFYTFAIMILVAFLAAVSARPSDVRRMLLLLFLSGGVVALLTVLRSVFNLDIFPWASADGRAFNTIGSWNALGLFFGFLLVTVSPMLEHAQTWSRRAGLVTLALVSLLLAALVDFPRVWVGVAVIAIGFLAYEFSRSERRSVGMPVVLLLVAVLLFLSRTQLAAFTLSYDLPLDVTPNVTTSFRMAGDALAARSVLGYGPGMFGTAWDLFKDPSVNTDIFWRVRFNSAASFALTLPVTTGALGIIAFLALVASLLVLAGRTLAHTHADPESEITLSLLFGTLFLWLSLFIYTASTTLVALAFLLAGLLIARAHARGVFDEIVIPILADSPRGFVTALVVILLMVGGVVGLYIEGQNYIAAVFYTRGTDKFAGEGNINTAERLIARAATLDSGRDLYHRTLALVSFTKLQQLLASADTVPADDVRTNFQIVLGNAIASAQKAAEINPTFSENHRLLGQIYEAIAPLGIDGAGELAVSAYKEAMRHAPRDPVLRDDAARIYIVLGDYVRAREYLEEALNLKRDYAPAHFRLAQIAALKGNIAEAITNTENAALAAPNDVGVLFQLGLLYYQADRLRDAEQMLVRATELSKNFSNARYFLGLTYARQGSRERAIAEFEQVLSVNPGNREVETILENLRAGKDPLAGISPPGPDPLVRENPPLAEDETSEREDEDEGGN